MLEGSPTVFGLTVGEEVSFFFLSSSTLRGSDKGVLRAPLGFLAHRHSHSC